MAIVKWRGKEWDPFQELRDLEKGLNRFFDTSYDFLPQKLSKEAVWSPSLDISEDKNHVTIKADLPGVKQSDIDISVDNNILTIQGQRKHEEEHKDKKHHSLERFYGSFTRSLSLPAYVDADKIKASYKDGVLEVAMPKKEGAKSKQVKVEVK